MSRGTSQGILADLKSLQRQVKGRLAEQEVELGELGHADTQLVQLESDLELLQAAPETWIPERQALVDQIEELSRAHALGEARSRQALKARSENARRLNQELHQTGGELVRASWSATLVKGATGATVTNATSSSTTIPDNSYICWKITITAAGTNELDLQFDSTTKSTNINTPTITVPELGLALLGLALVAPLVARRRLREWLAVVRGGDAR